MKLKQILSEIKLIPQNRILLKKTVYNNYYFESQGEIYRIDKFELTSPNFTIERDFYNSIRKQIFINFLKSKKIPYTIENNIIRVSNKYFICPDKLNEVKLIKPYPKLIKPEDIYIYQYKGGNEKINLHIAPNYFVYGFEWGKYISFPPIPIPDGDDGEDLILYMFPKEYFVKTTENKDFNSDIIIDKVPIIIIVK
jgi:hypothetical protein